MSVEDAMKIASQNSEADGARSGLNLMPIMREHWRVMSNACRARYRKACPNAIKRHKMLYFCNIFALISVAFKFIYGILVIRAIITIGGDIKNRLKALE